MEKDFNIIHMDKVIKKSLCLIKYMKVHLKIIKYLFLWSKEN